MKRHVDEEVSVTMEDRRVRYSCRVAVDNNAGCTVALRSMRFGCLLETRRSHLHQKRYLG